MALCSNNQAVSIRRLIALIKLRAIISKRSITTPQIGWWSWNLNWTNRKTTGWPASHSPTELVITDLHCIKRKDYSAGQLFCNVWSDVRWRLHSACINHRFVSHRRNCVNCFQPICAASDSCVCCVVSCKKIFYLLKSLQKLLHANRFPIDTTCLVIIEPQRFTYQA